VINHANADADRRQLLSVTPNAGSCQSFRLPAGQAEGQALSFVVGPHANHFYDPLFLQHLINQAVLNIDSPGIRACQISDELLERGWVLEGLLRKDVKKFFSPWSQAGGGKPLCILLRLPRVDELPAYQDSFLDVFFSGVFRPARIDSRMPGTESRCRVSWIERQSSSETRTAFDRLPVI